MTTPLVEITLPDGGVAWSITAVLDHTGLSQSSFTAYVARGQAPAPTHNVERTRLWDAKEIKAWWATRPGKPGRPART